MSEKRSHFTKNLACGLLSVTSYIASLLIFAEPSFAGFKLPPNAKPPKGKLATTTGTRSCGVSDNGLSLTLLAPKQHIGQTTISHPTFSWFIPVKKPVAGEFQIYKRKKSGDYQRIMPQPYEFQSTRGVMKYTLPDNLIGLEIGTDYVWHVLLRCGSRPSEIYRVRAPIERVDASKLLLESSAIAANEPASQLAEIGLWYDAFAEASQPSLSTEINELQRIFLRDLAKLEAATENEAGASDTTMPRHSEVLLRIAQ